MPKDGATKWICRRSCRCWRRKGSSTRPTASGTGRTSRIRPTRSACARCRPTTSSSWTARNGERVIGETDFTSGPSTLHEKAIYILEGQLFQVERLDFDGRKAYLRAVDCDYYTDAITYTKVTILDTFESTLRDRPDARGCDGRVDSDASVDRSRRRVRIPSLESRSRSRIPASIRSHGEVHVVSRVVGFKKIKFYTNENVGSGELDLPEQQMHTSSYWLTIPAAVMASLPYARRRSPRRRGRAGVRDEERRAAAADVRRPRHRAVGRRRHARAVDAHRRDRRRAGGAGDRAERVHLRQLSRRDRLQPAALRDARAAARADARPDRRVPVRVRLSVVRRSGREHGAACEAGGVADPRSAARGERRSDGSVVAPARHRQGRSAEAGRAGAERRRPARAHVRAGHRRLRRHMDHRARRRDPRRARRRDQFGQCLVIDRRYEADRFHGTHPHRRLRSRGLRTRWGSWIRRSPRLGSSLGQHRTVVRPRSAVTYFSADGLHRSRNDRAERRRRDGGVPGRVRIFRSRRVPGPAVPADEPRRRARAARGGRGVLRRRRPDRHVQRQDVRRAGDGDALDVPPAADAARPRCRTSTCCIRRAACGGRARARAAISRRPAAACRRSSTRCSTSRASATSPGSRSRAASSVSSAAAIRGRSSRCSSTTGSIWSRWPR